MIFTLYYDLDVICSVTPDINVLRPFHLAGNILLRESFHFLRSKEGSGCRCSGVNGMEGQVSLH